MAEVLGALSSVVTLLDVAVKGAKFIQGISEIQDDYKELCDEIANINDMVQYAQVKVQPSPSSYPEKLLDQSTQQLRSILEDLKKIESDVHKPAANNVFKAKKRSWLIKNGKIQKLLRRTETTKNKLHDAIRWQTMEQSMSLKKNADAISSNLAIMVRMMNNREQNESAIFSQIMLLLSNPQSSTTEENESRLIEEVDDLDVNYGDDDAMSGQDARYQTDGHKLAMYDNGGTIFQDKSTVASIGAAVTIRGRKCCNGCKCRCHGSRKHYQSPRWAKRLLGQWNISYGPGASQGEWDPRCRCCRERGLQFDYQAPVWLWVKAVVFNARCGIGGLQCALRPARIVPLADEFWFEVRETDTLQAFLDQGNHVYYNDMMEDGQEIFEHLIILNRYDTIVMLLEIWGNVLQLQGVSRRVSYTINWKLGSNYLGYEEANTLKQLMKYADDDGGAVGVGDERWRLHKAAQQGVDLQDLLYKYEGDATMDINEWDNEGRAPLHYAALMGRVDALQRLIDASADVNIRDIDGYTPLMLAAMENETECMQRLIFGHCRINDCSNDDRTALHWAVRFGSVDATRLLLSNGASVAARDVWGRTPLHDLSFATDFNVNEAAIEQIGKLLFAAPPVDPNTRDKYLNTPIMFALCTNNIALLPGLVNAGASTTLIDTYSDNLLHLAALNCNAQCMHFLHSMSLSNIDTQLKDASNFNPWDCFVYCINALPHQLKEFRRPSIHDQIAFITLYSGIRERNLQHAISTLKKTADALSSHDIQTAVTHLNTLSKYNMDMHNSDQAAYYRALGKKLSSGDRDSALRAIRGDIQDLKDELLDSPWNWHHDLFGSLPENTDQDSDAWETQSESSSEDDPVLTKYDSDDSDDNADDAASDNEHDG